MAGDAPEETEDEKERLKKFRKSQRARKRYASAVKANVVLQSQGYDHLEGPDFDAVHEAVSDEYQKKGREARVRYSVHGVVQGVGYRNLVRTTAKKLGITGYVRNVSDGSVEIFAIGDEDSLREFEKEIQVSDRYGAQTMHVEKAAGDSDEPDYADFIIERDKKL